MRLLAFISFILWVISLVCGFWLAVCQACWSCWYRVLLFSIRVIWQPREARMKASRPRPAVASMTVRLLFGVMPMALARACWWPPPLRRRWVIWGVVQSRV